MGVTEVRNLSNSSRIKMNRNYFEFRYVIGRGGFSKVWKVIFKKNQKLYALKEMSKVKIIDRKSEISIKAERDFLSRLHHPFIVNMIYAFQDYDNLYLVMDLLMGGDLRYHLCRNAIFSEAQTKFFIACLILGLEYIHSNNIIHRDIKPENLVLDEYDFGIAKINTSNNSSETSGTPGYMSPEVLCAQNHSFAVDFFAIGAMGYEFMSGERPYLGNNRKEIKQAVLLKQVIITYDELSPGWSKESADFLNALIIRNPHKRLGFQTGIEALKNHKWFNDFNWNDLLNKTMLSPFSPKASGNYDKSYCEGVDQIESETRRRYQMIMERDDFNYLFNEYTYINEQEENSIFFQSNRQRLIQQTAFNSIDNIQVNKTTKMNQNNKLKSKPMLIKTKGGLLFHSQLMASSQRMLNIENLKSKLKQKSVLKQAHSPRVNSRNGNHFIKYSSVIPKHHSNNNYISNVNYPSFSLMNSQYKTVNKSKSNLALNKNINVNKYDKKQNLYFLKKLENSRSCRNIGSLLPTLRSNYTKIIPGSDLNVYEKSTRERNKIILPINISSNYRSMSLIKSMSLSMTNSFLKHKLNIKN